MSKKSINALPILIENINIKYITKKKKGTPTKRFITKASILDETDWPNFPWKRVERCESS